MRRDEFYVSPEEKAVADCARRVDSLVHLHYLRYLIMNVYDGLFEL
jgi:hypothetical protein